MGVVPNPELSISVYNDAGVPGNALTRAEQRATDIFSRVGIGIVWLNCTDGGSSPCSLPAKPTYLALRLIPMTRRPTSDAAGVAYLGSDGSGRYADVFWRQVQDLGVSSNVDAGLILGSVMAHELGHLLLGSNAHAVNGIMQARWQNWELRRINMGSLGFLPNQGRRIRTRVSQQSDRSDLRGAGCHGF